MRILGIDPGYAIIGWGVLDYVGGRCNVVDYGAITTAAGTDFPKRLLQIYEETMALMDRYQPEVLSIEKLYFTNNKTTGIDVAQARGTIVLAAEQHAMEIHEYTPMQVKQAVVGYGKAEKKQVMEMTRMILGLKEVPKPDDTADALAMAICHGHVNGSHLGPMDRGKTKTLKIRNGI
jgi:crossover junction endodeoxyribonuclease RuvC